MLGFNIVDPYYSENGVPDLDTGGPLVYNVDLSYVTVTSSFVFIFQPRKTYHQIGEASGVSTIHIYKVHNTSVKFPTCHGSLRASKSLIKRGHGRVCIRTNYDKRYTKHFFKLPTFKSSYRASKYLIKSDRG